MSAQLLRPSEDHRIAMQSGESERNAGLVRLLLGANLLFMIAPGVLCLFPYPLNGIGRCRFSCGWCSGPNMLEPSDQFVDLVGGKDAMRALGIRGDTVLEVE